MLADPTTVLSTALPLLAPALVALVATVEMRDSYTHAHGARVAYYSMRIGHVLGLSSGECKDLYAAGVVHDVGKFRTPVAILHKQGPLTKKETTIMQDHAALGSLIVGLHLPLLAPAVRAHHEHYDGTGYPDHLSGQCIPLYGRIIAVADSYDAMTSDRPYRKGMDTKRAEEILNECRGTQWDGELVDAFLTVLKDERRSQSRS